MCYSDVQYNLILPHSHKTAKQLLQFLPSFQVEKRTVI